MHRCTEHFLFCTSGAENSVKKYILWYFGCICTEWGLMYLLVLYRCYIILISYCKVRSIWYCIWLCTTYKTSQNISDPPVPVWPHNASGTGFIDKWSDKLKRNNKESPILQSESEFWSRYAFNPTSIETKERASLTKILAGLNGRGILFLRFFDIMTTNNRTRTGFFWFIYSLQFLLNFSPPPSLLLLSSPGSPSLVWPLNRRGSQIQDRNTRQDNQNRNVAASRCYRKVEQTRSKCL